MKSTLGTLVVCLVVICQTISQDVTLEKVEEGHRIMLYAENKTRVAQEVTLHLNLEHVEADRELPITGVIPADSRILLVRLTPDVLKPWSYQTRYSCEEYTTSINQDQVAGAQSVSEKKMQGTTMDKPKPVGATLLPPRFPDEEPIPVRYIAGEAMIIKASDDLAETGSEIVVYGQDACPRCELTMKFLDKHSIGYTYRNVTNDEKMGQLMTKQLYKGGFTGGQVIMPVIVVGDETYFSIRELDVFLEATFLRP